jgi:hypothetical protein
VRALQKEIRKSDFALNLPKGEIQQRCRGKLVQGVHNLGQVSQAHLRQIGNIGFQRLFGIGSVIDVIEQEAGSLHRAASR